MAFSARLFVVALLLGAVLILSGCIQPPQAGKCAGFSKPADRDGCLRYNAIWDQEPYLCYSISDSSVRASCLEASNDPAESQKLKDAQANGIVPASQTPTDTSNPANIPAANGSSGAPGNSTLFPAGSTDARIAQCMTSSAATQDACTRQVAIETLNMSLCAQIAAPDFRASCISNVALTSKKPVICNVLNRTSDKQICVYYSSS